MISCKEIAHILSSEEDLSVMRKAELRMHLLMCKHCSNYNKQLKVLKTGMQTLFRKRSEYDPDKLTELENNILNNIIKKRDQ